MRTRKALATLTPVPSDEEIAGLLQEFAKRPRGACPAFAALLETDVTTLRRWMKGTALPGAADKRRIALWLRALGG